MNVGYVFDEGFAIPAAVSMVSLFMNNRDAGQINVYVLDDGISAESHEKLLQLAANYGRTLTFIDVGSVKAQLSGLTHHTWNGSYSVYIQLMLNTLLPKSCDRIIMLDADTIIDGSIAELAAFDLGNAVCAMALEGIPRCYYEYSGLGDHELYNAGLMIADLNKWQEFEIEKKFLDYLTYVRKENMLPEEDIIAKILQGRVARLPAEYNYLVQFKLYSTPFYYRFFGWDYLVGKRIFYALEDLKAAGVKPIVYHCIDTYTNRPWHENNIHPFTPLYDAYLAHTPWSHTAKAKKNLSLTGRMECFLRKRLPFGLSNLFYAAALKLYYGIHAKRFYQNI